MKITICGSIAFINEMIKLQKELEIVGHEVKIPETQLKNQTGEDITALEFRRLKKAAGDEQWIWDQVQIAMKNHFNKIEWSDAILVANYDKNNIEHYIGGNTLMEIGIALHLKKKIFLLNPIPDISYHEEIRAAHPNVIANNLSKIK